VKGRLIVMGARTELLATVVLTTISTSLAGRMMPGDLRVKHGRAWRASQSGDA